MSQGQGQPGKLVFDVGTACGTVKHNGHSVELIGIFWREDTIDGGEDDIWMTLSCAKTLVNDLKDAIAEAEKHMGGS